jgi:MFS family permease
LALFTASSVLCGFAPNLQSLLLFRILQGLGGGGMVPGAAICAYAMYDMTKVNGDLGFWFFATSRIYIGIGLPLVFLPIIAASYDGIAPNKTDMASAFHPY